MFLQFIIYNVFIFWKYDYDTFRTLLLFWFWKDSIWLFPSMVIDYLIFMPAQLQPNIYFVQWYDTVKVQSNPYVFTFASIFFNAVNTIIWLRLAWGRF
jgi:hypothetical protein